MVFRYQDRAAPELHFEVVSAEVLKYAALPTLLFKLRIENTEAAAVRSIALQTQIRIATAQRHYDAEEQERLLEVFGETHRWGQTLKSMLWTHTTVQAPAFKDAVVVDMLVPCTYDFEVVSAKYFHNLEGGEVPLEFLFSGTVFYSATWPPSCSLGEGGVVQHADQLWKDAMIITSNSAWPTPQCV
ncbi:MAG: DUF6084 family protein [Chloroflexia bacterium]